jgi:hypothetical protein
VLRPPPGFVPRRRLVEALGEGLASALARNVHRLG